MNLAYLAIMYFFVVVIIVLCFLLIKERQMLQKTLYEKDVLQEHLSDLKVEKVRMNHMLKMQDESIVHLMDEPEIQEKKAQQPAIQTLREEIQREPIKREFERSEPESSEFSKRSPKKQQEAEPEIEEHNEEPFIILNSRRFSGYEDEVYRNIEE
ncbi:hypothetical protein ACYSNR_03695 [Enterococcus sp. LJL128]|uniref:hypothetical protein n=1 Tax=Enterococcus sp. LJL51 TaxID=3416656 RepID=UPI003CEBB85C